MADVQEASCPNKDCVDFGKTEGSNIAFRGKYGKNHDKDLLYCRTCGKRFASTRKSPLFGTHLSTEQVHMVIHLAAEGLGVRATARSVGISNAAVSQVIIKVGEHCRKVFSGLMSSLQLTEVQLDELWTFVKKKRLLTTKKSLSKGLERPGAGQP
ncbi:MAG: hypothetical protein LBP22_02260 [Deltaproteobacteria bacterium]|jgi:hypothetical protein|nr:hypothetical protein [Deltaproteobacteria bacterium]